MGQSYIKKYASFLLIAFLLHGPAMGLIVKLADLHTMAKQSDIVIHGYVGDQKVTTDDLGRLVTLTEIAVIDGLHGARTGEIITVYQVGGQKHGLVMPIIGGQHYVVGQELFLFGLKMGDAYVSYGAGLGKLDVVNENGHELVIEDLGNVRAVRSASGKFDTFEPSPLSFPSKRILADEIRQMIKAK
ncbi:MAG TPA: hypothetical protein VEL47_01855 [Myxococcota bacterium]|nr:hypothetical protein [Myxococcota bacterium]